MSQDEIEYGSKIVLPNERGRDVDITSAFWSVVQEARWWEDYKEVATKKMRRTGIDLARALGHNALPLLVEMMSEHIPQNYEDALDECWQGIIDDCEGVAFGGADADED